MQGQSNGRKERGGVHKAECSEPRCVKWLQINMIIGMISR